MTKRQLFAQVADSDAAQKHLLIGSLKINKDTTNAK